MMSTRKQGVKGKIIKRQWFKTRANQLIKEHYPGQNLKCSDQSLARSCRRFKIAFRRKTYTEQTVPNELAAAISKFHTTLLRIHKRGKFELKDIANIDQTPLPFVLDDCKSYADKGSK